MKVIFDKFVLGDIEQFTVLFTLPVLTFPYANSYSVKLISLIILYN